jgi:hypothetical protein
MVHDGHFTVASLKRALRSLGADVRPPPESAP